MWRRPWPRPASKDPDAVDDHRQRSDEGEDGEQTPRHGVAHPPGQRVVALVVPAGEVDLEHEPEQSGGEDGEANAERRVRQARGEDEKAAGERVGEEDESFDCAGGQELIGDDGAQIEGDSHKRETEQRPERRSATQGDAAGAESCSHPPLFGHDAARPATAYQRPIMGSSSVHRRQAAVECDSSRNGSPVVGERRTVAFRYGLTGQAFAGRRMSGERRFWACPCRGPLLDQRLPTFRRGAR